MLPGIDDTILRGGSLVALAGTTVLALAVLVRYGDVDRLFDRLQDRFVYGIPWGTVVVVLAVYAIYHLLQGGDSPGGPIVAGFRSWSIWYPQGLLLSSFAHASNAHLIGNLLGTVTFAPIAEWAWGHYRKEHTWGTQSGLDRPGVRIALFVVGVGAVGIAGALFVPGAVIGFSGVVFAFAGVAAATNPLLTVLAILGIRAVSLVRRAALDPVVTATARPEFLTPWWADIALQGHVFGFLFGFLVGIFLLRTRNRQPDLRFVFFAVFVFAVTRSMFAVYWFLGSDRWILFQALGTAGIILMATLATIAVYDRNRILLERIDLSVRETAIGLLLAVVLALSVVAVPYNLVDVTPGPETTDGIEVRDYTVTYAEGVEDRYVSSISALPGVRGASVNVSGVVVVSDRRNAWHSAASRNQLAFDGHTTVAVGDATWRETVFVNRTTWALQGGNQTYKVFGRRGDSPRERLFAAEPAEIGATIDGARVEIRPAAGFYDIAVLREGEEAGVERIPRSNESVTIDGIRFDRERNELFAVQNDTEIRIAEYRLRNR